MISSVALQVIQCVVIAISARNGVMRPATEATPFLVKIKALFWHSFGYIGAFGLGPRWQGISPVALVIIGLIITGGSLGVILYSKRASFASKTMIGIGLSIVILTFAMNTIMLSHQWPINATQFTRIELYRHTIPAFYGFLMMALGVLICTRLASKKIIFGIVLIWGITTGWIDRGLIISKPPSHPTLGSSQWQLMAHNISRYDTIGIPVDPYGWAYLKNCQLIGDSKKGAILIQNADEIPAKTDFSLPISPSINAAILVGFGLSVTPASPNIPVILTAEIRDQAGITRREVITRRIPSSGGLLYFGLEANHIVHPIEIRMTANQPIRIWTNEHNQPEILWIGQP